MAELPERFLPPWLSAFALAEVLQVSPMEVEHLPARWLYRASVVLAARQEAQAHRAAT